MKQCRNICMKYETLSSFIFQQFHPTQPSSNCQISIFTSIPPKNCPNSLWLASHVMTLKSPPNQYALPCPIYITTMIRRHTKFSSSFTNLTIISVFDTYLTPKVTGSLVSSLGLKTQPSTYWGLNQDPSDSECSALTQFSMNLINKYGI